jgi:nucleotide-binding universal stress UspA family protein
MRIPDPAPVVVGVNGTAAGLAAVRLGAREAVARDRELRVLHAFNWPGPPGHAAKNYAAARQKAARVVRQAVASAQRSTPGVRVTGHLLDGPPARVLLRQTRGAELIVLGDDDLTTSPSVPIDSVLLQIVSHAWCPVLVARGLRPPVGPLLAAVDGSPPSLLALRHAAEESADREIVVEVVHVVTESGAAAEAAGRQVLEDAVQAVPELRYARTRLLTGDPAETLIRTSRDARMMVVGPRGHDGATLFGPVAHELLRRCVCPTVFVHHAGADLSTPTPRVRV